MSARRWAHQAQAAAQAARDLDHRHGHKVYEGTVRDFVYEQVEECVEVEELDALQRERREREEATARDAAQRGKSVASLPRCKVCTFVLGSAEQSGG